MLRRLVADAIDLAAGILLAFIASLTSVGWFFATRAVVMLRIGEPGTIWRGPIPMLMGIAGTFVYSLPAAMVMVELCEPLLGRGPGKWLMGLRIEGRDGESSRPGQMWMRVSIKASPWWIWTLGLLAGSWALAVAGAVALVMVLGTVCVCAMLGTRPGWNVVSGTRVQFTAATPRAGA